MWGSRCRSRRRWPSRSGSRPSSSPPRTGRRACARSRRGARPSSGVDERMSLEGQAAIVTGGGQGIGRAIALALAAEGADVAVFDVNAKGAGEAAAAIREQGRRALALTVDVTDLARVEAATAEVVTAFGRLDVLVNNAGWTPNEPFAGSAPETWSKVVAVNYTGVLNCTRAAL